MRTMGTFLIVELMRNGMDPQQACREALLRIIKRYSLKADQQVGYLAMNKSAVIGACSLRKEFSYALYHDRENRLLWADQLI
jgi:isoaspartyl peptidase/L-asparaginase-like protein (Ntn-hydrolase superfamily)